MATAPKASSNTTTRRQVPVAESRGSSVTDVPPDLPAALAEKGNQQGELDAGNDGGGQDDERGNDAPAHHQTAETEEAQRAQQSRDQRDAVAKSIRHRHAKGFQHTGERKDP
jgi:hypothetical protein